MQGSNMTVETITSPSPIASDRSRGEGARQARPRFRRVEHPLVRLAALGKPFDKFDATEIFLMTPNQCTIHLAMLWRKGLIERTPLGTAHAPKFLVIEEASPDLFPMKVAPCRALVVWTPPVTALMAPRDAGRLALWNDAIVPALVYCRGTSPSDNLLGDPANDDYAAALVPAVSECPF